MSNRPRATSIGPRGEPVEAVGAKHPVVSGPKTAPVYPTSTN